MRAATRDMAVNALQSNSTTVRLVVLRSDSKYQNQGICYVVSIWHATTSVTSSVQLYSFKKEERRKEKFKWQSCHEHYKTDEGGDVIMGDNVTSYTWCLVTGNHDG